MDVLQSVGVGGESNNSTYSDKSESVFQLRIKLVMLESQHVWLVREMIRATINTFNVF